MGSRGGLLFSVGILLFAVGYYEIRGVARRADAGWNLVPVIVVTRDMPAGVGDGRRAEGPHLLERQGRRRRD